ncbi:MAG: dihydrolipoyl dehydrogenase [Gudongella sp.]|nr:dihydrolipoyl dehydrogenase [Gudongella sp.]
MKLAIIGGGPGGYVAAIKAAELGAQVYLVEEEFIGGTCLNTGCIPTKVLLNSTKIFNQLQNEGTSLGLEFKDLAIDWDSLQLRKNLVSEQLVEGVKNLLLTNKIEVIEGRAKFISKSQLEINLKNGGTQNLSFDKAIIATGSTPIKIPIEGIELEGLMTSREVLSLEEIPESMIIIGGGVIGSEFANIYANVGTKVTVVEMLPRIVANMDSEITDCLETALTDQGVVIYKSTKVEKIVNKDGQYGVKIHKEDSSKGEIFAEKVLLATGRKPNTNDMGLEEMGVVINRGAIVVDKLFETSVSNIYAIGDCIGGSQLAHVASAQGLMVAELINGIARAIDFKTIPYCVYTKPELASVGLLEEEAIEKGYKVKVGRFPMYANGKAVILGDVAGLVKIVADQATKQILGVHIAGESATELISTASVAIRLESTVDEMLTTIYAHPTISEAVHEASEAVFGHAIHIPK